MRDYDQWIQQRRAQRLKWWATVIVIATGMLAIAIIATSKGVMW